MEMNVDCINEFIDAKERLLNFFGCSDNYFLKPLLKSRWTVVEENGYHFLNFVESNDSNSAIIVKREGTPLIYDMGEYTLIIAIDCVKIGFMFRNSNKF